MITKEQAITEIATLAATHNISLEELTSALGRQEIEANKRDGFTLTRVFSYLGGIFILAGLSGYTTLTWGHLNSFSRILITLGPGIICIILASAAALQNRREKNITILVLLSAIFQSTGLFVAVIEFSTGGGDIRIAALAIFGVLAVQYSAFFAKLKRTSLLFFAIYFGAAAFISLADIIDIPYDLTGFISAISLLALSYGIQRTPYNSICGFGYFVGSILLLLVGFDMLRNTYIEMLYLGVAGFMLYVSTIVRSRSMLVTSTISIFSYISYFTAEHFANSVGWPICLIFLGILFFFASNLVLKLSRRFIA